MKIIVCVKVVSDPEAPASLYKINKETKKMIPPVGTAPVVNPFDENALEAALKIKHSVASSITVISLGKNIPKAVIRKTLATGADNLFLLEDEAFEDLDSYSTATVLAKAILKQGDFDLILCGREAADTNAGQVGLGISEILSIPGLSLAGRIEVSEKGVKIDRILPYGSETLETELPALITVSNEIGKLRSAPMSGIMAAQKKPVTIWNSNDLAIDKTKLGKNNFYDLSQPVNKRNCEFIASETFEEAGIKLANRLREANLI